MSKGGSLDANVLLRLILRDVPSQSDRAMALLSNYGSFDVADTAVIETVFALERYYEVPRLKIQEYMLVVTAHPKLNLNRQLFLQALPKYTAHPKLSFEDCCLATYAQLNDSTPLWTFDAKLFKQLTDYAAEVPASQL